MPLKLYATMAQDANHAETDVATNVVIANARR